MYGNNMNFRGPKRSFAPVKVGDEMDIKIEAVGEKGDGIAKKDGFVLFVPNTKVNDEVRIRITRVLRKVGFAEVVGAGSAPAEGEASNEPAPEGQPAEEDQAEEAPQDSEDFGEEEKSEEDKEKPSE